MSPTISPGIAKITTSTTTMPRQPNPKDLTINLKPDYAESKASRPDSSPMALQGVDLSSFAGDYTGINELPPLPTSPKSPGSPKHNRDVSKNLWTNLKLPKQSSTGKVVTEPEKQGGISRVKEEDEYRPGSSGAAKIYHLRNNPGSTPELSLIGSTENVGGEGAAAGNEATAPAAQSRLSPQHSEDATTRRKDNKHFRNPLTRTKSIGRRESATKQRQPHERTHYDPTPQPPNTAPLTNPDWQTSADNMFKKAKDKRGKSADRSSARPATQDSEENLHHHFQQQKPNSAPREKEKNAFVTGGKSVVSKAKSGGGNFLTRLGKIGRSSSNNEPEIPDSQYQLKIINLPLIEQTRETRISKDMGTCRDKTEFWMPALPWRCIDYLNLNCEVEGLYRIPGSLPQIKKWQRRFDTERDVNIFDVSQGYDEHEIASVLKAWLRELPTEVFPKQLQLDLAEELQNEDPGFRNAETVPQKVRDTLSSLPPFNYYLLFAITCHLSLLLSHQDKNKMNLENLAICIGPCLNLEHWLFTFLVGDWRHCWQGCFVEQQYLDAERAWANGEPIGSGHISDANSQSGSIHNGTALSSDSDNPSSAYEDARAVTSDNEETPRTARTSSKNRDPENARPVVYKPSGYGTNAGTARMPDRKAALQAQEVRRPATAEDTEAGDVRDRSHSRTPRQGHNRSQSDLLTTPTKASASASSNVPEVTTSRR